MEASGVGNAAFSDQRSAISSDWRLRDLGWLGGLVKELLLSNYTPLLSVRRGDKLD